MFECFKCEAEASQVFQVTTMKLVTPCDNSAIFEDCEESLGVAMDASDLLQLTLYCAAVRSIPGSSDALQSLH